MENKIKLNEQGLEEYPKAGIILGNILLLVWIALGTIACWYLSPPVAWIYLALAIVMVFVVLRKMICVHCYYYGKWCSTGWGKLSALFFKQGDLEKFATCPGFIVAPLTYGSLILIPILLIVISLLDEFSTEKIIVLGLLVVVSISGVINRWKSCAHCKMQTICPGAAAKKASRAAG